MNSIFEANSENSGGGKPGVSKITSSEKVSAEQHLRNGFKEQIWKFWQ